MKYGFLELGLNMKIRQQLIQVHKLLINFGAISLSKIGKTLGISKDSARRRCVKIKSRSNHPCASVFETEAGIRWLRLLIVAAILVFGIKSGDGSETLSIFFSIIGIDLFVGLSASSVDKMKRTIDSIIAEFGDIHDEKVMKKAKDLILCAGADETFFEKLNILLLMDLPSGFILTEEFSDNRKHRTWEQATLSIVKQFKAVACLVSDKAKPLVKLAKVSYECINVSDLFHMLTYITKFMKFKFNSKIKKAQSTINKTQKTLENEPLSDDKKAEQIRAIKILESEIIETKACQASYRKQLHYISVSVHPFDVKTNLSQTSKSVEEQLRKSASELRSIQKKCEFDDKYKYLNTFENQIDKAASQVDSWWGWVKTSSEHLMLSDDEKCWAFNILLPVAYWQQQFTKARRPLIKECYNQALLQAEQKLQSDQMTEVISDERLAELETWANWISEKFQRTTSSVEGRNGLLSLAFSSTKGLSKTRLRSRTVIDNYFTKRSNGTTAMERFTKTKPDCLISFIMENLSELPMPRSRKCRDPVINVGVAA